MASSTDLSVLTLLLGTILFSLVCLLLLFVAWFVHHTRRRRSFENKRCCIVGAAHGIGQAVAETLAKQHVGSLILVDVASCEETKSQCESAGCKDVICVKCDIASKEQVEELFAKCNSPIVDLVVNCAGVVSGETFQDLSIDKFKRVLDVNLVGTFTLLKYFLPPMLERNEGCFISISSLMGLIGAARLSDYCASKFGLVGMMEALRMELSYSHPGVSLVTVCPYAVKTGMFEGIFEGTFLTRTIQRVFPLLTPQEVADAVIMAGLRGNPLIIVPFSLSVLTPLVRCVPSPLYEGVLWLMGGKDGMQEFKGRSNVWG